ncbi:MAG TPA: M3 family metallopeptidase, partial [Saprospiraceae bacterium]|nr:M3 family metallopeptidase [Saprospiraceae bacterium]
MEFLPDDFKITTWAKLKPYYDELLKRPVLSAEDLEKWLRDRSELEAVISEEFGWRYIRLSQNSEDTNATEMYQYAVQELMPRITVVEDQLNRLLVNSSFADQLPEEKYFIHVRGVKNEVELFREENIPLYTEDQLKSKDYGAILSQMTIEMEGKQLTLQQASILLEETDRTLRESVYRKINTRQLEDREKLDQLFDELRTLRQQMAVNAGFENYRDFKFKAMGRFDYEVQDCYDFHDSIAQAVLPVLNNLYKFRKSSLRLDKLRPWDLAVDTSGKEPLRPFKNSEDLIEKSIRTLETVHPFFGECLATMDSMQRLDLESRKGKHPGGYNMPLYQSGVPFIFMNASGSIGDLHTLMHESGHAVH